MASDCSCLIMFLFLFLFYKFLDWLIRIPFIGRYSERYIFVTGCDTGFGNLLAKRLDSLGCHVFAGCLTEAGETELKKCSSARMLVLSLDISKPDSVRKAFQIIKEKLPPGKGLWGLVNNAGISGNVGPPEWSTVDEYKRVNAVNLYGTIDVTMTFLPLVKTAHGRVVNVSSNVGRLAVPMILPYCVSKYGVEAFTDGLRRSLHVYGCKAILIEPGAHKTPIFSMETVKRLVDKAWNETTPEIRAEFGEEVYNHYASHRFIEGFEKISSDRPQDVVDADVHALLGSFPRARYVVGKDARLFYNPVSFLPEWFSDLILRQFERGSPMPAALRK